MRLSRKFSGAALGVEESKSLSGKEDILYNLLVTSNVGAWDFPAYKYDRERFCEHTAETLRSRFKKLTAATIEELKSFPTLFAYEGQKEVVRVGYIRRIKERGRTILIEYEFDEDIPAFNFFAISGYKIQLDIGEWEMNRTHWAIKDEDLFEILASAGVADQSFVNKGGPPGRVEEIRFKVALSFPGEQREYVAAVADELKRHLGSGAVFYDKEFTAQLARPNLDTLLQRIYLNNSDLVVVFLSEDYERKQWCGLEWRAIRAIIKNKSDHALMFMRFDDAIIAGSLSIDGYVDLKDHSPVQAARMIVERVRLNDLPST